MLSFKFATKVTTRTRGPMSGRIFLSIFIILVCSAASIGGVQAQQADGVPKAVVEGDVEADGSSGNNSGTKEHIPSSPDTGKFPTEPQAINEMRLPAHTALRGLMDSKQYKEMLRGMITSKVPVMYQTMMMVENGAATGFIGSVQNVSQLLSNSVGSADLELTMRGVIAPEEQKKFVEGFYKGLKDQKPGAGKNLWPVGLYAVSKDKLTEPIKDVQFDEALDQTKLTGPGINLHLNEKSRPKNSDEEWTITEVLTKMAGTSNQRTTEVIDWIKRVIGDVKISAEQPTGPAASSDSNDPLITFNKTFIRPTLNAPVKNSGSTSLGGVQTKASGSPSSAPSDGFSIGNEIFGASVERHEIRKDVWRNMYKLLGAYCNFKKENPNAGTPELFKKKMIWEVVDSELIKKISSTHFKVSLNLIDQIFKVWVQTSTNPTTPTEIQCKFDDPDGEMPENFEIQKGVADNCEGTNNAKNCRRNKWLYRFVDIIALDKLMQNAKDAYEVALQLALVNDGSVAELLNELFCASIATAQGHSSSQQQLCNLGFYFDSVSGSNKARWHDQLEALAKLAQSLGGSSNFRFQPNNSFVTQGGGFNPQGDQDPSAPAGSGGSGGNTGGSGS